MMIIMKHDRRPSPSDAVGKTDGGKLQGDFPCARAGEKAALSLSLLPRPIRDRMEREDGGVRRALVARMQK